MSEMIERVAEALCDDWTSAGAYRGPHISESEKNAWRAQARGALLAMRRPTEPMLQAGVCGGLANAIWQAMIDAALDALYCSACGAVQPLTQGKWLCPQCSNPIICIHPQGD